MPAPIPIARDAQVTDVDTAVYPPETFLEILLSQKPLAGEYFVVKPSPALRTVVNKDSLEIRTASTNAIVGVVKEGVSQLDDLVVLKSVHIDLVGTDPETLTNILHLVEYYNNAKVDRGRKKPLVIALHQPKNPVVRASVVVEIAPHIVDFSLSPSVITTTTETAVPVAASARVQLTAGARFFDFTVAFVTGHEPADKLALEPPTDGTFYVEGQSIMTPSATEGNKKKPLGALELTATSVHVHCDEPVSQVLQAILRSVRAVIVTKVSKEVCVEVSAACAYGQSREIVRIRI